MPSIDSITWSMSESKQTIPYFSLTTYLKLSSSDTDLPPPIFPNFTTGSPKLRRSNAPEVSSGWSTSITFRLPTLKTRINIILVYYQKAIQDNFWLGRKKLLGYIIFSNIFYHSSLLIIMDKYICYSEKKSQLRWLERIPPQEINYIVWKFFQNLNPYESEQVWKFWEFS